MGLNIATWLWLFVFVWVAVAPALLVAHSERSEGSAKLAWVVLSLVFSWLTVLVWVLITQKQAGRVDCLYCWEPIRPEAHICPHCGTPGPVVRLPPEAAKLSDAKRRQLRLQLEGEALQKAGLAG